jgi:hypothetical protein
MLMAKLQPVSLTCHTTQDWDGSDEIYVTINDNRVWGPRKMKDGEQLDLTKVAPVPFRRRIRLDMYDLDAGAPVFDDHLGRAVVYAVRKGSKVHEFNNYGADYTLEYRVTE